VNVRRLVNAAAKLRLPVSDDDIKLIVGGPPLAYLVLAEDGKFHITSTPAETDAIYGSLMWHLVPGFKGGTDG
jgi:hypothetical protein